MAYTADEAAGVAGMRAAQLTQDALVVTNFTASLRATTMSDARRNELIALLVAAQTAARAAADVVAAAALAS